MQNSRLVLVLLACAASCLCLLTQCSKKRHRFSPAPVPTATKVQLVDSIPTLLLNGQPYTINAWTVGHEMDKQTNAEVKAAMDTAKADGFEVVEIELTWRLVESVQGVYDWSRIDELMDYAHQQGLYVMLGLDARFAPAWFADTAHPDAVFVTYDPNPAAHPDMVSGRLVAPGELSLPIFYHPGFYMEVDRFYEAAVARYRYHPALLAWELCIFFTGEYNYPGGYTYGIAGFADYSAYTEGLYGKTPPYPLEEFSQAGPDTRSEWQEWTRFRLQKKRESLDHFSAKLKALDPDHIVVAWPCASPLWGEVDNGLVAEAFGGDYLYILSCPYIDVIRVAPQVSTNLLEVVSGEMSPVPYLMQPMVRAVRANGKAFMLQTEREVTPSDLSTKIAAWTYMAKTWGVQHFLWWQVPIGTPSPVSGQWTAAEKAQIMAMKDIIALPEVDKFSSADFAFLDTEFEWGKYYADNTYSVLCAMKQVKAFLDAGLPFECVSEDEIAADPSALDRYKTVGLLHPDSYNLLAPSQLKTVIMDFQASGGALWNGDPLDGFNYYSGGYTDTAYLDNLRTYYDTNLLTRHNYSGHGIQIIANRPYIFLLSRSADFAGTLNISISGWDLPDGTIELVDTSGAGYSANISGAFLEIDLSLTKGSPLLLRLP